MKKLKSIHTLRIWNAQSSSVRHRFYMKDEIIIGSDPSADLRLKDLPGIYARLDFRGKEIQFLEKGELSPLEPGSLIQLESSVIQWSPLKLPHKRFALAGLCGLAILGLMAFLQPRPTPSTCSAIALQLSDGLWISTGLPPDEKTQMKELIALRRSFISALKSKEWVKARAELNSLKSHFDRIDTQLQCGAEGSYLKLESQLAEALIQISLENLDLEEAALEVQRFKSRFQERSAEKFEKRLLRVLKNEYLEAYRLEDEDPEQSELRLERIQRACVALQRPSECYRERPTPRSENT